MKLEEYEFLIGFYRIPNYNSIVISRTGVLFSLLTNRVLMPETSKKGYKTVKAYNNGKRKRVRLHRLLAYTLLPLSNYHAEIGINKLDINHRDSVTYHNDLSNLEIATRSENNLHSARCKRFSNIKEILSKDIRTEFVTKYNTISECSIVCGIEESFLIGHLKDTLAGRLTKDWCVFKFNDGKDFPLLTNNELVGNSLGKAKLFFVRNIKQKITSIYNTALEASVALKINLIDINDNLSSSSEDIIYNDEWVFYYYDINPSNPEPKWNQLIATNTIDGEEYAFNNAIEFFEFLGLSKLAITDAIINHQYSYKHWVFGYTNRK